MMEASQTIHPTIGEPLLDVFRNLDIEKTIIGTLLTEALAFKFVSTTDYDEEIYTWMTYKLTGLDQQ
jgi:hypothetical protein